jgi:hypothetical protein
VWGAAGKGIRGMGKPGGEIKNAPREDNLAAHSAMRSALEGDKSLQRSAES